MSAERLDAPTLAAAAVHPLLVDATADGLEPFSFSSSLHMPRSHQPPPGRTRS
jgi:hypothetical protein